jgi:MFS family permease
VLAVIYLLPAVQFSIGAALVQTLAPIVADRDFGLGAGTVGAILGVGGLARLVAALAAGQVMDRIGRRAAMIPGLALQLAGVSTFAFWRGEAAIWLSIVLISLGSVGVNAGTAILADLSEGGRLGPRLGAFRFTGDAAFLVAPLLSGWLLEISGRTAASVPLLILTSITLLGAALIVPETNRVSVRSGGPQEPR